MEAPGNSGFGECVVACPGLGGLRGCGMLRRWWWILLVMAVVGPILGFLGAALVTYVMPKKYESVAVLQAVPEPVRVAPDGGAAPMGPTPSRFLATEMEVIRAEKTLARAVDALDLSTRWGVERGQAIRMVRETVHVGTIRGTDLIEIRVRHTNAEDARDLALEVAQAYRARRAEFGRKRAEDELAELRKILQEQKDRVEERRKALEEVLDSMGIAGDAAPDGGDGEASDDPVARQRYLVAREDFAAVTSQFEEMALQVQAKRIELELPRSPVVIHEEPVVPRAPVSPNVKINLLLGLVAGVPAGLLLALPIMMLADRIAGRKG